MTFTETATKHSYTNWDSEVSHETFVKFFFFGGENPILQQNNTRFDLDFRCRSGWWGGESPKAGLFHNSKEAPWPSYKKLWMLL